ncbi:RNA polymerase sigma factor [Nocardioides rubriscoriae]|uniref:RNA polymerase sigma factor n=1 Tax=Nocardioides rubriscoriae TaxID=642762 RepID=UPI0011DF6770|nr:RNA polymerase sigma factor [Nocardioides rubriscoriae]
MAEPPLEPSGSPDDDLVARAKDGDPDAWRELYREHAGRLVAWLRLRPTGDAALTADDVAADAWLVAASKIADFDGTSSEFAGWLFGIARKISFRAKERSDRRRTAPGEVSEVGDHLETVADPTLAIDTHDWVRHTLESLPPRERDVVGLIDGLGLDTQGAAVALGMTQVAVRVARHRGLRRLERIAASRADLTPT